MASVSEVREEIHEHGGFKSIQLSPHLRFRAGQRRVNWDNLKETLRKGDIEKVEENPEPNENLQYKKAYLLYLSVAEADCVVPFYILETGGMLAVTVVRE